MLQRVLTVVVSMLLLHALVLSSAQADGCFVLPRIDPRSHATDISEPSQKAVIIHSKGQERLILQVSFKGSAKEFAWLVPTPTKPEVEAIDEPVFHNLHELTATRIKYWLDADVAINSGIMMHHRSAGGIKEGRLAVEVIEQRKVGVYDIAVLHAQNAEDLIQWLRSNKYNVTAKLRSVLSDYIQRGWVFTAARINTLDQEKAGKHLEEGTLQAIQFDFAATKPIYPLKVSSLNSGRTNILIYTITDHRLQAKNFETLCAYPRNTYYTSRIIN